MKYLIILLTLAGCGSDMHYITASGPAGTAGSDGLNSLVSINRFSSDTSICSSGTGILVKSGLDTDNNGVLDTSEITNSNVVCDGLAGQDGLPGTPAPQYAILKFITPCPLITSAYREVIIKLVNGQFLSSFSASGDALTVRLALIPNGSYVDTDGSNCNFTVSGTTLIDQYGNVF